MILTNSGVLKLMQRIKSFITAQLNTKAASVHTHSISEIDNLSSQLGGGYTKSEVDTLLTGKADTSHTHTKSDITDFPTIPSKTSDLTNDSGFLTSHQDLSGYIPTTGGAVFTGTVLAKNDTTGILGLSGGTTRLNGGSVEVYGKDNSNYPGWVVIRPADDSNYTQLILKPDGTAKWGDKYLAMQEDFIPRSGGAVMTSYFFGRNVSTSNMMICGGAEVTGNAHVQIFGGLGENPLTGAVKLCSVSGGSTVSIVFEKANCFRPTADGAISLGSGNYRWGQIYSTNATISTSDARLKNSVKDIDDKLLDAWESIEPKQYKFNDATETKGEQARFHTGYLAQDIEKACIDNDIDISKYGLFCYDSWEEEPEITEDVEVENDGVKTTEKRIVQSKKEKGDIYALRYEEALIVECAYLRREVSRLKKQNENFEQRLKMLEQSVK